MGDILYMGRESFKKFVPDSEVFVTNDAYIDPSHVLTPRLMMGLSESTERQYWSN
jgi:hypothetical protein